MNQYSQRNLYILLFCVGILPLLINGWVNAAVYQIPYLYWSFEVLTWVVVPVAVFAVAIRRGGLRFSELGLHSEICGRRNVTLVVLACLIFAPIDLFLFRHVSTNFRAIFPSGPFFQYQSIIPADGSLRLLVVLYLALTAGIVEEMYFRGFLFRISRFDVHPNAAYLVFSPFLFAAIHWEGALSNVMATYVWGLVAAVVFVVLRNLWPLIIGHIYTDYIWFH